MNEEEKLNKIEEEDEEFSLSEDIALATRQLTSSESSKVDEKKKRKFKPGKFISKHLKIKKDEKRNDSEDNSETRSEDSNKSPNLGALKRNIAKKFSRKKKSQVSPYESGESSQQDEPLNNERDLKEIEKLSNSDFNISYDRFEVEVENVPDPNIEKPESPRVVVERKASTPENKKKVQLQITISGKKIEKLPSTANAAMPTTQNIVNSKTDKASAPLQFYKSQNDIVLPTVSTAMQVNKTRQEFLNVMVNNDSANVQHMQHHTKSISNDAISQSVSHSTVTQTISEGYISENVGLSRSEQEIEKYSLITSSLNSIISTAKDLETLDIEKIKFPENIPELKIREEFDREIRAVEISDLSQYSKDAENKVNVKDVIKEFENLKGRDITAKENIRKQSINSEDIQEELLGNEDMRKSKIPINKRRTSSEMSSADKDVSQSTVHTQEAHKPYHLNLSSSLSCDELKNTPETKAEEIKFEVGTAVRPQKILSANTNNVAPIIISEIESEATNVQESIDDVFHSPKSVSIEKRDSRTRRKIAYIPQLTIYTPEEQELLRSNIIANYESFDTPSLPPDSSMFPVFDDSLVSNMTPTTPEKREYLYKILVIGELGTGKTSFIKRYVHQFFSQNYRATIGVDFALKVLNWDQSTIIRLQLWDIAGQERFGNMTRVYYKEAVGAFIVFDVTRQATFDAVNKWKTDLDSKVQLPDGSPIPCILLANKCDQPKQGLVTMPAKMDEYCKQNGFAGWFETSAKENTNIEESSKALVSKILLNDKLIHNDMVDGDRLILNAEDINKPKKFCSC